MQLAPVIHRRTDGLPLFLVNVVDALVRQGLLAETAGRWAVKAVEAGVNNAVRDSLRRMIEQQLRALTSDEQRLLGAASVAGTTFSAAALAAAVDDALESVEDHHQRGDVEDARRAAQEAIAVATTHGISSYVDDGAVEGGDIELGGEILDAISEDHHGLFAPEIARLRGDVLLRRDHCGEAEASFKRAIELAQRRSQRSSELRATTSLARLLVRIDRRDEARRVLADIYGWFTEGFETADLREARALLDELADPAPPSPRRPRARRD